MQVSYWRTWFNRVGVHPHYGKDGFMYAMEGTVNTFLFAEDKNGNSQRKKVVGSEVKV